MKESQNPQNPHIIIIPAPYQGHVNPTIQLALKLASKGFIITFINTHYTHDQITKARKRNKNREDDDDLFAGARESGLDIRYRIVNDGFPLSFDRSLNRDQFMEGRIHVFPAHVDELVCQLAGSDPRPACLVSDTFSTCAESIASKYGLVFVSFWTQPALVFSLYRHLDLLKKHGHYGSKDNCKDTIDYIPGVKAIEPRNLISFLQETDTSTVMHRVIQKVFSDAKKGDFIVCNTVQELEPESISTLKETQPVYAIGPLFPSHFTNPSVEMSLWSQSDCKSWLSSKPRGSVLYASFGSYAFSTKEDIKTIANGLMLSGVNFIWVLRPGIVTNSEVEDVLPDGFQENVGNRGVVVQWCKQNSVIANPAVGGYLTHCGWNSILESIWVGLPMVCFPLVGDQTTNRKLVVEDWKIGINLCQEKLVSCDEVADSIKFLMSGEKSRELRKNIEQVRKKLENAVSRNGSSEINFDKFVGDLKARIEMHKSEEIL